MAKDNQYHKLADTPVPKLVTILSIPAIGSMLITNIYNLVDTAFVGKLGTSASGAVGVVFGFMAIIQAIGFMFGQGSGTLMSRHLGSKDLEGACSYASIGFFCSFFFGLLITVIGFLCLDELVMALGSTPTIAPYAKTYIAYILVASPFLTSSLTMNNLLRYEGKAAMGMIGLMTGGILNMLGDPIFMFGFDMGIAGAGLSTCLSQVISFGILLSMFLRKVSTVSLSIKRVFPIGSRHLEIVTTGFPSLIRQGLNSVSTVLLNSFSSGYGDAAVAAMSIVNRIVFFIFSIALGIGQGFQPVSSFNWGAGKKGRVKQAFVFALKLSFTLLIIASAITWLMSENMVGVFRDDPQVIAIGTRALRLNTIATPLMAICMCTEMLCQTTGKRLTAALLSAVRSGILFIPLLFILNNLRGLSGIQEAQPLASLLGVIPAIFVAVNFLRSIRE